MAIYVEKILNRSSPPAVLIRQAWREGKRIRRKTLANISKLPPAAIAGIRSVLKGGVVFDSLDQAVSIRRSLPHGHVAAVLGLCRQIGLPRLLHRKRSRSRELALACVVARVLFPASNLASARFLSTDSPGSSLGSLLGLGPVSGNELLANLDWLRKRQPWIQRSLARRHLQEGSLLLYDVTSSYFEGNCCPLAAFGYNRDGKRGKRQLVCGLLCAADGCPVAVEVFPGNTADPGTVAALVRLVRQRFGMQSVALAGDRGMLTTARIREDLGPAGLDWVSALKTTDLRTLLKQPKPDPNSPGQDPRAPLRPGELVPDQVAEIHSPDFPGERLLVCLNPRLKAERARKRESLLRATEEILERIADMVRRRSSPVLRKGKDAINRRVGREANRKLVEKHFTIEVSDDELRWSRKQGSIEAEGLLDGIYVVRTSMGQDKLAAGEAVAAHKRLARIERAFRNMKTDRLQLRPVYVYDEEHVRGHVFVCMLAYYVEWHLRRKLAPLLFEDADREAGEARRKTPVEPAKSSLDAQAKAAGKQTPEGLPVQSLETLLEHLKALTLNEVTLPGGEGSAFLLVSQASPLQAKALDLLGVDPDKIVSSGKPA
ncbi:MAG: IS1634 family transposase [Bryobacterales bacterium]|nr:IS1634 family transposase [Bryobacterales bacterium]